MKICKQVEPPKKRLGDLKNGDLFERADVDKPCTIYMVTRHDRTVFVTINDAPSDYTYVVDLKNSVFKAMQDDIDVIPLEQDDEIVVKELS